MLNPTAWPLSSLKLGLPVLKKKALQDELANEEGFSETCRLLAQRNPRLWQVVMKESDQWRLWSQHLSLAILWHQGSVKEIETRLMQLKRQLHCRWTLLLPVDFKHWSQLQKQHAEAIAAGQLQLVQPSRKSDNVLPSLLATNHHWVVLASTALWTQPHRWALIQRLLTREPQREVFPGDPVVVRRHWWIKRGGHLQFLWNQHHEQVHQSPNVDGNV